MKYILFLVHIFLHTTIFEIVKQVNYCAVHVSEFACSAISSGHPNTPFPKVLFLYIVCMISSLTSSVKRRTTFKMHLSMILLEIIGFGLFIRKQQKLAFMD
jgi:hypothetical protein